MNVREAYQRWSSTYDADRNLTRDLDEQITRQNFKSQRYQSVFEIGCGTGKNTSLFAEIAETVQAVDFSPAMLERARRRVLSSNVTFNLANVTRPWAVADSSINLISCNLVLEHIEDLSFIFAEAARVLVNEGEFFISELHPFRQYLGTQARFQHNEEPQTIDAFVHHLTDFVDAGRNNNLSLEAIKEWWHEEDHDQPPRLISFLFKQP